LVAEVLPNIFNWAFELSHQAFSYTVLCQKVSLWSKLNAEEFPAVLRYNWIFSGLFEYPLCDTKRWNISQEA